MEPESTFPYVSAAAFRQAITSLAENAAHRDATHSKRERMEHFAYARLLARLFVPQPSGWVLKGGIALLARLPVARHSTDLDLAREGVSVDEAIYDLRRAAGFDIEDYFDFEVSNRRRTVTGAHSGASVPVTARVGGRIFSQFRIDVVCGLNMTGVPDVIEPIQSIDVPGLVSPSWVAYPVVDHIADKLAAIYETHGGAASNRYRDLVDLALVLISERVAAGPLRVAVVSEFRFRGIAVPEDFEVPDPTAWKQGYEAIVGAMDQVVPTFEEACNLVGEMVQAISEDGTNTAAVWDPISRQWSNG